MNLFLLTLVAILVAASALNTTFIEASRKKSESSDSSCVCTTAPCPETGTNTLTVGGGAKATYTYALHNDMEAVTAASVKITSADLDQGTDTTSCTQAWARSLDDDGKVDCDAGHILAHRLGGPGTQPINIFCQEASINRGVYAQFEGKIYECIKGGSAYAELSWKFDYESSKHTKPSYVTYSAKFGSGGDCTTLEQKFNNFA